MAGPAGVAERVGFLGFSCLDGLAERGAPGGANWGLLDQIAALEWVRDEIARFGGDPEKVTVFGESAGAGSIVSLLAMPAARGLFRRAIIQSAAVTGMIDTAEAGARAEKLLAKLGLGDGADLRGLREVPAAEILEAQRACLAEGPYTAGMFFVPVVDGRTLPRMPLEAIADGAARDAEVVIGTTADELQLYAIALDTAGVGEERMRRVAARLAPGTAPDGRACGEHLVAAYREARAARGDAAGPADLYHAITSDERMRLPAIRLAELQAHHQPRTYMYLFTWRSPMDGGALGSCHALDLPFTFGTFEAPRVSEFAGTGPAAQALADRMMDAWLAFARRGNPSHPGIGEWAAYDEKRRATMLLGERCGAVDAPLEAERLAWLAARPA